MKAPLRFLNRMLVAVIQLKAGFVVSRLAGPEATVEEARAVFRQMIESALEPKK